MRGYRLIISLVAVVTGIAIFIMNSSGSDEDYIREVEEERAEKEEFMRTSDASPFKEKPFEGLKYYPVNPEYKVMANVRQLDTKELVELPTSDGKVEKYQKYAVAEFNLKGERHQLTLLRQVAQGMQRVTFLAFADQTSGETTYGGGRYLDVSVKNARQIALDFNKAYNPYCDYNPTYSCPLPLKENILTVAIEAGEKTY